MHPILAVRGRLIPYLAAWIPAGGLLAVIAAVAAHVPWVAALALMLPLTLVFGMLALTAWFPCRSQPLRGARLLPVTGTHLAAAILTTAVWLSFGLVWARVLSSTAPAWVSSLASAREEFARAVPVLAAAGVLLFLLSSAVHYLVIAFESARTAERGALQAQVTARDAELRALRSQLDPHFLFNALNSIAALVGNDPAEARRMCVALAEFLRKTLDLGRREVIPLSEELALADAFLALERVRFGERLRVEHRVGPTAMACLVPPLILQPLVENAVRHGIGQSVDGGTVAIEASRDGHRLEVAITNPCDADPKAAGRAGLGLSNVRARLAALYGGEGRLDVGADGRTYRAVLRMPALEDAHAG